MTDRSVPPEIQAIKNLELPLPKRHTLDNGIPVFEVNMGTQGVLKLEIVFEAGRPFEQKPLVSRATASMLKEGTRIHSAAEIAERIDFYGGTLTFPINLDSSTINLYCLTRHFDSILPLIGEMLDKPSFPEEELRSFKERNKSSLQIDLSRNDVIAYREITELIYGKDHPYGYNSNNQLYDAIERADLKEHFQRLYHAGQCKIFISGKTNERTISQLNTYLGKTLAPGKQIKPKIDRTPQHPKRLFLPHEGAMQTAIRIGRRLFNRNHIDYPGMYILNTILGGYFGSRLMANIREDKGFTYNIYSSLDTMHYDGYFYIGTEVGNQFAEASLEEIYKELRQLRERPIEKEELDMVRNYLMGNLLTMLDGPFNVMELLRTMELEDVHFSHFDELVHTIHTITPDHLQSLAQKYLRQEDMWEVVVG